MTERAASNPHEINKFLSIVAPITEYDKYEKGFRAGLPGNDISDLNDLGMSL
jgi:hypothetical protein